MITFRSALSIGCCVTLMAAGGCASRNELDQAKSREAQTSAELSEAKTDQQQLHQQNLELSKELAAAQKAGQDTQIKLAESSKKLADSDEQLTKARTDMAAAQKDHTDLEDARQKLAQAEQASADMQKKLADADKSNADAQKQITDLTAKLDAAKAPKAAGTDTGSNPGAADANK